MKSEDRVAGDNIFYLEQGMDLIRRLDDSTYTDSPQQAYRGGVGAQIRHCIDFYGCFLRGLAEGRIDYSRRKRDAEVETSRDAALRAAAQLSEALGALKPEEMARPLQVRSEDESTSPGTPEWSRSSVGRELQFLVSHTVHHYALIAALLKLRGYDVHEEFPEFGVAPSTVKHWKETGSATR